MPPPRDGRKRPRRPSARTTGDVRTGTLPGLADGGASEGGLEPTGGRLVGTIDRVTFHNAESGFCVLRVEHAGGGLVTLVGRAPRVAAGEYVEAEGQWARDPTHGLQFKAESLHVAAPTTRDGMVRYLSSGAVHGIGPSLADRLVTHFGGNVFDVIEREPERLREVDGVGPKRAMQIAKAWGTQRRVREIMVFLHSHGIGSARAARIHHRYGDDAIDVIRRDPYCLARDVRGIGFPSADALARSLGVAPGAAVRVRAGLHHVLEEARTQGHTGLALADALGRTEQLLGVHRAKVEDAVATEVASGALVRDGLNGVPGVFSRELYRAEREVAARIASLARGVVPWPEIDASRAVPWAEERLGVQFAAGQRAAVAGLLRSKVAVMTGGPGVGKTTLLRALLEIVSAKGVRAALAAPTGRAARRLQESTGHPASTLHRLLEIDPRRGGFLRGPERALDCDLVIIDEASMVDVPLAHALLRAVPDHAALWWIGDADQLPSVGPGRVLADLIRSDVIPVVRLTEIFRQAAESAIVRSAHCVLRGEIPDLTARDEGDFFFVGAEDPARAASLLIEVVAERIPRRFSLDPVRDIQVLCPMRRGSLGAVALNRSLQERLNPHLASGPKLERYGNAFAIGDKVMQLSNDYEKDIYNGDVGFIRELDPEEARLVVDFDDRRVEIQSIDLDALAPCYATTIHKSQGSEYPAVVIVLASQHHIMLQRNLVYTAMTRGRKLVVILGERRALATAVRRAEGAERVTKLRDWLVG